MKRRVSRETIDGFVFTYLSAVVFGLRQTALFSYITNCLILILLFYQEQDVSRPRRKIESSSRMLGTTGVISQQNRQAPTGCWGLFVSA